MKQPAIFLDRDGVINRNRPDHIKTWGEFEFLPGVLHALRRLAGVGLPMLVVSNQAAIGRGLTPRAAVDEIHRRMVAEIRAAGGRIDNVLYCPHRPEDDCACRKPRPGLLLLAAERLGLCLASSCLVGDAEADVLAAQAAGCRAVLVKSGRGVEQLALLQQHGVDGYHVAADLTEAAEWIVPQLCPSSVSRAGPASSARTA